MDGVVCYEAGAGVGKKIDTGDGCQGLASSITIEYRK
jgi:hypothetical protein